MKAERFVVDSNVLISAALRSTGTSARLIDTLREASAILLFSDETLSELCTRLMREKFDRYVSKTSRQRFLAQLDAVSEIVAISNSPMGCRDKDDDKFLETAVLGDAACLVTGDEDLLVLHPFQDIPILKPADCLARFFNTNQA